MHFRIDDLVPNTKVIEQPKQSNPEEKKIDYDMIEELAKKFGTVT